MRPGHSSTASRPPNNSKQLRIRIGPESSQRRSAAISKLYASLSQSFAAPIGILTVGQHRTRCLWWDTTGAHQRGYHLRGGVRDLARVGNGTTVGTMEAFTRDVPSHCHPHRRSNIRNSLFRLEFSSTSVSTHRVHSAPTASVSEADGIQFMRRPEYQWQRSVRTDTAHPIALPEAVASPADNESTRRRKSTGRGP